MSFAGLPAYLFSAAAGVVAVVSIASLAPTPRLVVPPAAEQAQPAAEPAPAPAVLGPVTTGDPATIVPPSPPVLTGVPAPLPPARPDVVAFPEPSAAPSSAPETTGTIGLSALAPLPAPQARATETPAPRRASRTERLSEDEPRQKLRQSRAEASRARRERRRKRGGDEPQGAADRQATAAIATPAAPPGDPNANAAR